MEDGLDRQILDRWMIKRSHIILLDPQTAIN
jgi:hypothetical protein